MAKELGVADRVHLLGYRRDIAELNHAADVFCFPSLREGLSASLMEAMASGLPVICSRIRGNTDLIDGNGGALFGAFNVEEAYVALKCIRNGNIKIKGKYNRLSVSKYSMENVLMHMRRIYADGV